jgi:protein SCO1/2
MVLRAFAYYMILVFALSLSAEGEGSLMLPNALKNIDIEDKAGAQIPLDISLIDHDGQPRLLSDYIGKDELPTIITLGYFGCPMLCNLVLNGLLETVKKLGFRLGKDYRIVTISIDEKESSELALKKRNNYLAALLGTSEESAAWSFHVTKSEESKRLAQALGFNYRYDESEKQFAHGAGIFVISPKGILSRTLFGINFQPSDLKLALSEAAQGKIGSFIDRVILSCFHYNPDSHRYGVYIFGVMRLGGIITVLILALMLVFFFRGERRRAARDAKSLG